MPGARKEGGEKREERGPSISEKGRNPPCLAPVVPSFLLNYNETGLRAGEKIKGGRERGYLNLEGNWAWEKKRMDLIWSRSTLNIPDGQNGQKLSFFPLLLPFFSSTIKCWSEKERKERRRGRRNKYQNWMEQATRDWCSAQWQSTRKAFQQLVLLFQLLSAGWNGYDVIFCHLKSDCK